MPRTPQIDPLAGMKPLGLQLDLRQDQAEVARRQARTPLKAIVPQKPCDIGLFSDESGQSDLVDMARR